MGRTTNKMNEIRLTGGSLSALVLPERGGKLASIREKRSGFELLYQPRGDYAPLRQGMPFSEGDASGFDDVFPSMGEDWFLPASGKTLNLPDHGEIWTAGMEVDEADNRSVRMHTFGKTFPFRYDKEISLRANRVRERITVTNLGEEPFPGIWVCHCLMRLEPDTRFEFPEESGRIECLPGCSWPPEGGAPASLRELRPVPPPGTMMKFYFRDPVKKGQCVAVYPRSGIRAVLRFSPEQLPYLGFWITNGGYRGEANFAFEPASGYYDTLEKAAASGTLPMIAPGQSSVYEIGIEVSSPAPAGKR